MCADSLGIGPPGTVTLHGCCRNVTQWNVVSNMDDYKYCAANLMLASCDDIDVRNCMDSELLSMMHVPVSFDVQHPNKVSGHFTMGYFAYAPELQRMVQLAMVMIPATDMYNGHAAKSGDNTKGNTEAKEALDIALRMHLTAAFPQNKWSDFSYAPLVARVSDEGAAGNDGQASNDKEKKSTAGCQFHAKQSFERLKVHFLNKDTYAKTWEMVARLTNEPIPDVFWACFTSLIEYLFSLPASEQHAVNKTSEYIKWHYGDKEKRERLCEAFRPMGASASSVAEIGHASQQKL